MEILDWLKSQNNAECQIAYDEIAYLRQQLAQQPSVDVLDAAKAVVERWDTPLWKDVPHTAIFIHKLRDALQAMNEAKPVVKDCLTTEIIKPEV